MQLYCQENFDMATTAIWNIKGWLGKILIYVENPDKTEPKSAYLSDDFNGEDKQNLSDVIAYTMREEATVMNEETRLVSGLNCMPATARQEMMAVKIRYGKVDGNMAFHGYQSFAEDEVTPQLAHEIGVKLAQELWGDRFQVIIATHIDKKSHIHNHFVLNSVSFLDGYRYNDCKATYRKMRQTSDRLCREYGLSVLKNPKSNKSKHYAEWLAEKEGRPTWRNLIKNEVDDAIASSLTDKQFFYKLKEKGYFIKKGKDITVRPPGKERGIKLQRNFGDEYSYESICKRILMNDPINNRQKRQSGQYKVFYLKNKLSQYRMYYGLSGRYLIYFHHLRVYKKGESISNARIEFIYKEDLRKLNQISQETKLLCTNHIETYEQLFSYQSEKERLLQSRMNYRKHIRYQLRAKTRPEAEKEEIKKKIQFLNKEIDVLRKEVGLCEDIVKRSKVIQSKLEVTKKEQSKRKEVNQDEYGRRGR